MTSLHSFLVNAHIAVGSIALVLFWVPAIARKGSPLHVNAGKIYVICMYIVAITAFIASIMVLIDPIGIRRPGQVLDPGQALELAERTRMFSLFLLMLSVLVFASVRHGVAALRERKQPGTLLQPLHLNMLGLLALLGITVGVIGVQNRQLLLIIFGGISLAAAVGMLRDTLKTDLQRKDLLIAHFSGLIGSGIGAYTAFFAFGGSRLLGEILSGQWQVVPWVLPSIVGTVAINRLRRRYERAKESTRHNKTTGRNRGGAITTG